MEGLLCLGQSQNSGRTRQDRVQAIKCCNQDLEGSAHMGNRHLLGTLATKSSGSHLEVTGMMYWSTASILGAPMKEEHGLFGGVWRKP